MEYTYCPIDERRVDGCSVRLGAFLSSVMLALYIATGMELLLIALSADFLLKNINVSWSPLSRAAAMLRELLQLEKRMISFAPKQFAFRLGFAALLIILFFDILQIGGATANGIGLILFFLMFMEWAFDYCVGCRIYQIIQKIRRK